MSFNILHCARFPGKVIDYALFADVIKQSGADIIGLNEVYGNGPGENYADQAAILAALSGMPYYYFAKAIETKNKGPYGNAILSRYPIEQAQTILIPDPAVKTGPKNYETRCILKAQIRGITVLVSHFGLNPDEEINAVLTVLKHAPKEKCIVMGDFNVQPGNGILMPLRDRMKDAADAFTEPLLSFPTDVPDRKIDYIFVSKDIRVLDADIPRVFASDHFPHTATVQIDGA